MPKVPAKTAVPLIPPRPTLTKLRQSASCCKACDLWKLGTQTVATVHPFSILRAPDEESRQQEMARFIEDLRNVADALRKSEIKNRAA